VSFSWLSRFPPRNLHSGDIAVKDENGYIFIVDFRAASSSNPA
jgi:hypothetical protein